MTIDVIPAKEVAVGKQSDRAGTTVLPVEDDAAVRNIVTRLLKLHGYHVLPAESGRAALPLWERRKQEIDFIAEVLAEYSDSKQEPYVADSSR